MSLFEFTRHHYPVRIYFAADKRAWSSLMKRLGIDHAYPTTPGHCTTFTKDDAYDVVVITLSPACETTDWVSVVGLMTHESVHAAQKVEVAIGDKLGDEPEAYLVQSLTQWLIAEYRKAGRGWRVDE